MIANRSKQQGAALFVSLIFLLILTVLGIASMNDTIMQGKMAAAIQDGNVALQGAETAVRDAEQFIETIVSVGAEFTNSNGKYDQANAPDPYAAATWTGTVSREADALTGQTNPARYYIVLSDLMSDGNGATSGNIGNNSHNSSGSEVQAFRIVARATGGTTNSQRIIESFYGKAY